MANNNNNNLNLEKMPNNVFVTQLHQRDDDELDDEVQFPIVKESGSRLLETGINTLQKTLVLKKEAELNHADNELMMKRKDFQARMEAFAERRIRLQEDQSAMKERIFKFEKFIQENEAKRRRAMQKYQQEIKMKHLKEKEFEILNKEMEVLKVKHKILSQKVKAYKKYEVYLLQVVDILPPDYIKVVDNVLVGLMLRHSTLDDTYQSLLSEMNSKQDTLKEFRMDLARAKEEHDKKKLSMNQIMSNLHNKEEKKKADIEFIEQKFLYKQGDMRNQIENIGMIMRAINNICEKCLKRNDGYLPDMDMFSKLDKIKDYVIDANHIVQTVQKEIAQFNAKKNQRAIQFNEQRTDNQQPITNDGGV